MFSINKSSSFLSNIEDRLKRLSKGNLLSDLDRYGQLGVQSLSQATPVRTGLTARSWDYRIVDDGDSVGIEWFNTNEVDGTSVAILIQHGHGTGTGGFVHGRDFINPAMRPVFDRIEEDIRKKVRS